MLNFKEITLEDKNLISSYLIKDSEGSCQHCFTSMFTWKAKYQNQYAIKDNYLFILRKLKENDNERCYLFPFGDKENKENLKKAINEIINDAHYYNKKVIFNTITLKSINLLNELFPNKFINIDNRDFYEYIYDYNTLANLLGHKLASKRYDIKTFYRDFPNVTIKNMEEKDLDDILKFQEEWYLAKTKNEPSKTLEDENKMIKVGLANFNNLNLKGIIVYDNNNIIGYAYGVAIDNDYFDVLIEKGAANYPDVYKILNKELVKIHCQNYKYINREEDIGIIGLRKAKESYCPTILLQKFIAKEKDYE